MSISKKINSFSILLFLIIISTLISYTYYFNHTALAISLIQNDIKIYEDKTNLFFLINNSSPSILFDFINILLKIGISEQQINIILTSLTTFFNLSGIYLISKHFTSSTFFSLLISFACVLLRKNFGDVDYPTLMFTEHTMGQIGLSLSTLIFGLLTLKNLIYAYLFSLILLSIHLVLGTWMIGAIIFTSCFIYKKINYKKISVFFCLIFIISIYYFYSLTIYYDIPYEFNYKDYEEFFFYIEAHRNNYGNLNNFHIDYILKSLVLLFLIIIYLKFDQSNLDNNYHFFLKTLFVSIIFSGLIYFAYKTFPHIFPKFMIKTIPQRFFLTHSIVGYPVILLLVYKFLEFTIKYFKLDFSYLLKVFSLIILFHLFQQHESINNRLKNIKYNQNNIIKERVFWNKVKNFNLSGFVLTNNPTCNKVIIHTKLPILFCFYMLDNLSYFPNLISPSKKIVETILGISFKDVEYKNLGGIIDPEIKKIYEEKNFEKWKILKRELNLNTVIVPKDWNLNIDNLLLDDLYKVYRIN